MKLQIIKNINPQKTSEDDYCLVMMKHGHFST